MSKKKKTPRPDPEELSLPPGGVESHAHLDFEDFEQDLEEVLARAARVGISRICNVFLGPDAYEEKKDIFAGRDEIFFLLGIHPHDAKECNDEILSRIQAAVKSDPRIRGLGEMGLDYYWDHSPRDVQQAVFRDQLELARELDVPVIIHSRDADEDVLRILSEAGFKDRPLLWHCFGRDRETAETILAAGWHISIPGPITFRKSTALRRAAAIVPTDRMMLETDCPFLTPEPYRGKRNEPAYLVFTAAETAKIKGMDPADLWLECGRTAERFFGLK